MDPVNEDQLDFGDEDYTGASKMQYQGGGAISALADDEMIGDDDEYDDLYNDVNVGDGFLQVQHSQAAVPSSVVGNGGFYGQKIAIPEPRAEPGGTQQSNIPAINELKYPNHHIDSPALKGGLVADRSQMGTTEVPQPGRNQEVSHSTQIGNVQFQSSTPLPPRVGGDPSSLSGKGPSEPAVLNPSVGVHSVAHQMPPNAVGMNANPNVNRPINNDQTYPLAENGGAMLFVGELQWWTTDSELETVLSQYGSVKEIKFFDERASGKSKGYCQVEFYDAYAATACKEGMNGHVFNGRACVVAFASPQTIKQMASSYANTNQAQPSTQPPGRRPPMNDGMGRGGGVNQPIGDTGRNLGRGGWARGGPGILNRGPSGGPIRGRGPMGSKNMMGNNLSGAGAFVQNLAGPTFNGPPGGLMHHQGIMGGGFDPTYMGRGAGYGGFSGPPFPGMLPPFPAVNPHMGLAGVAPHVNPAFFARGMAANGLGMMGHMGMDGQHAGMWNDSGMSGGWGGGEEHGQKTRESSYGGEDGASEYGGHGEEIQDKGGRINAAPREKERNSSRDWPGNSEKRHRSERDHDRDRSDRDIKYKEEKDGYRDNRQRERDLGNEEDWDRGQSSSRSRSRSKATAEEDYRRSRDSRDSRDSEYGRRKRRPSE